MSEITRIFTAIEQGDAKSTDELRRLPRTRWRANPLATRCNPPDLVHEAWLKLVDTPDQSWQDRAHLFDAAAEAKPRDAVNP